MAWKNTVTVNINEMGTTKGLCLVNTRKAPSPDIQAKYQTAHEAAQHAILHPGTPPSGVWVPVYFDFWATVDGVYKNWGHVGWYRDGAFYSDGVRYASISAYNAAGHTPRYIGWGELLNDVRVVQYVADPTPAPSGRTTLHLDRGTITTTYNREGGKVGSIYARDDSYNYTVREDLGTRVKINSASGGGDGVYVYLNYTKDGSVIPGRHLS